MRLSIFLNLILTCLFAHAAFAEEINRKPGILGPPTEFPTGENAADYAWLENVPSLDPQTLDNNEEEGTNFVPPETP